MAYSACVSPSLDALAGAGADPALLGARFERSLGRAERSRLGAHFTSAGTIARILGPLVTEPLLLEWDGVKRGVREAQAAGRPDAAVAHHERFLDRLRDYRLLDPACGSGNFLYAALGALKDLELHVLTEGEALGLPPRRPAVGPRCVRGIELDPRAAELARLAVALGERQWMERHGLPPDLQPCVVETRDALFPADPAATDGAELWPEVDVILGNPPFLGDKVMARALGRDYVARLRRAFAPSVPGGADLVSYWFAIADRMVRAGRAGRAGFLATSSIRGGANRAVLEELGRHHAIFEAWSDEPWVLNGAAVRVSLVCFGHPGRPGAPLLDGRPVERIHADLTGSAFDLTRAVELAENEGVAFNGVSRKGPFEVPGEVARRWLEAAPECAEVLRPWINGLDLTRRPLDRWLVHFGERAELEAARFEAPFRWVRERVRPRREESSASAERRDWWLLARRAPAMRAAIGPLRRYLATPEVSKHRVFVWIDPRVVPDKNLVVIAKDDDATFGVLHSRFHRAWALRLGSSLEDRPRYTSSTTFRTFPFPPGLTPRGSVAAGPSSPPALAIAEVARALDEARRAWLWPPALTEAVAEVVPDLPPRLVPHDDTAARLLKTRTLTELYNARPTWLLDAHRDLDAAVAAAYGWPADISEDAALAALLEMNRARCHA